MSDKANDPKQTQVPLCMGQRCVMQRWGHSDVMEEKRMYRSLLDGAARLARVYCTLVQA